MTRPLIAYFSPLKPVKSGIADYSEQILPYLARYMDIHLYGYKTPPENPKINKQFKWFTRRDYELQVRRTPYDLNVYQMGNSHVHQFMYPVMLRNPGAVMLHDANLHHSRAYCHLGYRNLYDYLAELTWCHGKSGEHIGPALAHGYHSPMLYDRFPMLDLVCKSARSVLVHNDFAYKRVAELIDERRIFKVPHPCFSTELPDYTTTRKELGINGDEIVISTFGFVTPGKGLDSIIAAFKVFRQEHPEARCVLTGGCLDEDYEQEILQKLDHAPGMTMTGYVSETEMYRRLASSDICIALRFPTQGETSGALLRVLGAGKPVIIPDYRQFKEIPRDACVHIPVSPNEPYALLTAMRMLTDNPDQARDISDNARQYAKSRELGPSWTESLVEVLCKTQELPAPVPLSNRCPLRHVRVAPVEESVALALQNWGESATNKMITDPLANAMKELGLHD